MGRIAMAGMTSARVRPLAAFAAILALGLVFAWYLRFVFAGPTPEAYIARFAPNARVIASGSLMFEGESFRCGAHPTVFHTGFSDYGAAYFGFIVLNPDRFASLPRGVKRFAYAHECGHQYVGYSERDADCYAVKKGIAESWLGEASLEELCTFFSKAKGTALHLAGPQRCAEIRKCYRQHGGK
jgi:hypothetical protein